MFAEDISEDFSEGRRYHFYWIVEYFWISLNLRGRLLFSEKFSEALPLWVFTFKQFQLLRNYRAIVMP